MDLKKMIMLMAGLIMISLVLAACTTKTNKNDFQVRDRMDPQSREKMMEERLADMEAACNGLSEGDKCVVSSVTGEQNGSCELQNQSLICRIEMLDRSDFRQENMTSHVFPGDFEQK